MTQPESVGSVTKWIEELRDGDSPVHPEVWRRYFAKLAHFVDYGFPKSSVRAMDGEDVASAVLETVCRKVADGSFPELRVRSDLWNVLLTVAKRKLVNQTRLETRQKRGGGRVLLETDIGVFQSSVFSMDEIADKEPTLDSAIALHDTCNYLIEVVLREEKTKDVARLKLEGMTNAEIAAQMGITIRTVERKIKLIRSLWAEELGMELSGGSNGQDTDR